MVFTWVLPINQTISSKFGSRLFEGAGVSAVELSYNLYTIIVGVFVLMGKIQCVVGTALGVALAFLVLHNLQGLVDALGARGISIPGDVSIISFDNLKAENPPLPNLTSIYTDQNIAEIGVKMLLERMDDLSLPPRNVILPVKIFDGGTTSAPSQGK